MSKGLVLVTGGAGYVGSVVSEYLLKKGFNVRVLDLLIHGEGFEKPLEKYDNFEFLKGDVRNTLTLERALENVDFVVHLAAIVGAPESRRIPELTWDINYQATCNLVDIVKREGKIKRFVFASTCSNYGKCDSADVVTEESQLSPASTYAETKVKAEEYILSKADSSFCPTICRFSTVYGLSPRMRFDLLVNEFVRDAMFKRKLEVRENTWRSYVHVEDIATVINSILTVVGDKICGEVFNVGTANYCKHDLVNLVSNFIGNVKITYDSDSKDTRNYKVSFDKIESKLNFKPNWFLEDGIEQIKMFLDKTDIDPYSEKYSNFNSCGKAVGK